MVEVEDVPYISIDVSRDLYAGKVQTSYSLRQGRKVVNPLRHCQDCNHIYLVYTIYMNYMNTSKKLWFKRKMYGWGWTPCSWQGWLITVLYIALLTLFVSWLEPMDTFKQVVIKFILPLSIITLVFIEVAYKKGETPKWQWGKDKLEK